ncbi:MAG: hypothetical protein IPL65_10265 [Lewinellaceae bacterium]|nr:hypothetical protein [Lewinellaceae bacterium]
MALQAVLDKSKDLIRQGETGKAISVLLDALDQDKVRYADTIRTLELVASDFNLTRKKEQRGTLQASELQIAYNKSNEALLGIIDALGTGVPPLPAIAARVHWKRWILLLIPLAMLMWMLVSYLNQKQNYCRSGRTVVLGSWFYPLRTWAKSAAIRPPP